MSGVHCLPPTRSRQGQFLDEEGLRFVEEEFPEFLVDTVPSLVVMLEPYVDIALLGALPEAHDIEATQAQFVGVYTPRYFRPAGVCFCMTSTFSFGHP